jgi:hypothetical protein
VSALETRRVIAVVVISRPISSGGHVSLFDTTFVDVVINTTLNFYFK